MSAADAIRRRDKLGRITMLSAEPHLPIRRPLLSKNMVVAVKAPENISVREKSWFEKNQIDIRLSTTVTEVDIEKKCVFLCNGDTLSYDKLIWAASAECFVPNILPKELDGVFTVRHLNDVFDIWGRLPKARNAVVIGGGILGLEMAAELRKFGLSVTILEREPRIMSRQLDDETSNCLLVAAANYGVKVFTEVNITDSVLLI